jgi:hypothetical protein
MTDTTATRGWEQALALLPSDQHRESVRYEAASLIVDWETVCQFMCRGPAEVSPGVHLLLLVHPYDSSLVPDQRPFHATCEEVLGAARRLTEVFGAAGGETDSVVCASDAVLQSWINPVLVGRGRPDHRALEIAMLCALDLAH